MVRLMWWVMGKLMTNAVAQLFNFRGNGGQKSLSWPTVAQRFLSQITFVDFNF